MAAPSRILVVKLGALGNVILSFGPFAAIRRHHPHAHITLLTTAPFAGWLEQSPWFDEVWIDQRPEWWDLPGWLGLRRRLIGGNFERAYDLQTSGRSSRYFHLFPPWRRPAWSGIARGCALPDLSPDRARVHDIDRQFTQLRQAGITARAPVDLSWSRGDIASFALPPRFALLAPGSSPHRPVKRWPAERYGALALMLGEQGLTPVVVGTAPEQPLAASIRRIMPDAIDLTGRTGLPQLTSLARAADLAVGNDTGPMHLIAATGCNCVVLFSRDSDPRLAAPRGDGVTILQRPDLSQLDPREVHAAAVAAMAPPAGAVPA